MAKLLCKREWIQKGIGKYGHSYNLVGIPFLQLWYHINQFPGFTEKGLCAKVTEPLFWAHSGIYILLLNSDMDADQLVMKMQNDVATLEHGLTVIKVNHMLTIQTCNLTTRYLAACYDNLCFYWHKISTFCIKSSIVSKQNSST